MIRPIRKHAVKIVHAGAAATALYRIATATEAAHVAIAGAALALVIVPLAYWYYAVPVLNRLFPDTDS